MMTNHVFTIGHSTHRAEKLIELLKQHRIDAVADVRSQPYSRMNPQFNRESVQASLKAAGMYYVFMGHELGARTDDRTCYIGNKVQYERLARTASFQAGMDRILRGSTAYRIALMCSEKDPLTCHRTILVCRHLVERGLAVQHILEDGRLESHEAAMTRLLHELGLAGENLFLSKDQVLDDAYARRGEEIAYVQKRPVDSPTQRSAR